MSVSRKNPLSLLIFIGSVLFITIEPISFVAPLGPIKDLRFFAPIFAGILLASKIDSSKYLPNKLFISLTVLYTFIVVYTLFVFYFIHPFGLTFRTIVNVILLISPLIFSWGIVRYLSSLDLKKIIEFFFWLFAFIYFIQLVKGGISISELTKVFRSNLVEETRFDTESTISLLMGFYCLFFLDIKKRKMAIFAAILTLMGAKRIAIFGLLVSVLFYYFYPLYKTNKSARFYGVLYLVVGLLIVIVWDGIMTGRYDEFIQSTTGLSPNRFFVGRLRRYSLVLPEVDSSPVPGLGLGVGYIQSILFYVVNFASGFHGDFYRLYLEFGFIFFACWLYIIGKFASYTKLCLSVSILLIIMMLTDNVINYVRVMYSYYLITSYSLISYTMKRNG